MSLNQLKNIWNLINNINPKLKTLLILLLTLIATQAYVNNWSTKLIEQYVEVQERSNQKFDNYTLRIAPYINEYVLNIQQADQDCFNVLLLNYHNSKKSLQGIRYVYLNCIIEKPKGLDDYNLKQYWSDLEYIYYDDELSRIHNQGYLQIENIDSVKTTFPKLYKKLVASDAKSAGFYVIQGTDSPIGIIAILYREPHKFKINFYKGVVNPWIQKLAIILDYPNTDAKMINDDE